MRARRVAVLWEYLTGYVQAAIRGLTSEGIQVLAVQRSREPHASYARALGGGCEVIDLSSAHTSADALSERVRAFAPDVTLVTTNKDPRYHAVARDVHRMGRIAVWGSEIPPRSLWRDAPGALRARMGGLRHYDAALVAGASSRVYAGRVGFPASRIFEGLLTCDASVFRPVGVARHSPPLAPAWPRVFLFVGQFIPRKGIDVLLEAYARYRRVAAAPWALWCAGAGPLKETIARAEGVRLVDFLPPVECAALMAQAGAMVLPSRIDHWGIVIHEATCAGLPVIATQTSHASADLVEEGQNGMIVPPGDVEALTRALTACADEARARLMGARSLELSRRFNPKVFATMLGDRIPGAVRIRS